MNAARRGTTRSSSSPSVPVARSAAERHSRRYTLRNTFTYPCAIDIPYNFRRDNSPNEPNFLSPLGFSPSGYPTGKSSLIVVLEGDRTDGRSAGRSRVTIFQSPNDRCLSGAARRSRCRLERVPRTARRRTPGATFRIYMKDVRRKSDR